MIARCTRPLHAPAARARCNLHLRERVHFERNW